MHPIAFKLGPLTIHWYGILVAVGFLVGLWLASRRGVRDGLPAEKMMLVPRFSARFRSFSRRARTLFQSMPGNFAAIWRSLIKTSNKKKRLSRKQIAP